MRFLFPDLATPKAFDVCPACVSLLVSLLFRLSQQSCCNCNPLCPSPDLYASSYARQDSLVCLIYSDSDRFALASNSLQNISCLAVLQLISTSCRFIPLHGLILLPIHLLKVNSFFRRPVVLLGACFVLSNIRAFLFFPDSHFCTSWRPPLFPFVAESNAKPVLTCLGVFRRFRDIIKNSKPGTFPREGT